MGCVPILQLLMPHVSTANYLAFAAPAARGGRMRPLKALRALQPPFPLPANLLVVAASGGHRGVIEYLQSPEGGGPHLWSKKVTAAAAANCHPQLLAW